MREFDAYVDLITDAPAVFRPYTGLSILAALVGRKVTAPFGAQDLVPNLYSCLLAPSSFYRKTTLINVARGFIGAVKPRVTMPDDFTPERFLELLAQEPQAFMGWPEFAGFLARSGRDYNSGARELLMELYDCPEVFRRELKSSSVEVKRPAVTILGASATSWLSDRLKGGDLRSGFLHRFAFVLAETKSKSYPLPAGPDPEQRSALTRSLHDIAEIKGAADLTRIKGSYEAWYQDLEREAAKAKDVEVVSAFFARLSVTALKIAILLELSQSQNLKVTPAVLEEAIVLTDYLRATVRHLLRVEFAPTEHAKMSQRIQLVIEKHPGIKRGWMLKRTGYKARDLQEILATLKEQGDVYAEDRGWWPR